MQHVIYPFMYIKKTLNIDDVSFIVRDDALSAYLDSSNQRDNQKVWHEFFGSKTYFSFYFYVKTPYKYTKKFNKPIYNSKTPLDR